MGTIKTKQIEALSQESKYAGFWIRVVAGILDSIVLFIAFILLLSIHAGLVFLFNPHRFFNHHTVDNMVLAFLMLYVFATTIAYYLYFALLESSPWQATIGMKACGLKITDINFKRISFWRALGRELCAILSGFILYIGFFMIAFTKRKQGLHDLIADTYVVKA